MQALTVVPTAEILSQIVEEVFIGMLGMEISQVASLTTPTTTLTTTHVVSRVRYSGSWQGMITLVSTREGAGVLGKRLTRSPMDLDEECLLDAFGEVTNILAGSLKPLLPEDVTISIPETGPQGTVGSNAVVLYRFLANRQPFFIELTSEPLPAC